jgi:hypothetical protein
MYPSPLQSHLTNQTIRTHARVLQSQKKVEGAIATFYSNSVLSVYQSRPQYMYMGLIQFQV